MLNKLLLPKPKNESYLPVASTESVENFKNRATHTSVKEKKKSNKAISPFQTVELLLRLQSRKGGSVIDGTMAGDKGFDPLGVSNSKGKLFRMREIELKHCRIAMLAAVGWPFSELFHQPLRELVDQVNLPQMGLTLADIAALDSQMGQGGRAPSILNGALLQGPNAAFLGIFAVAFAAFEYFAFTKRYNSPNKKEPGDFGFDPLNLYEYWGQSPAAKFAMREKEISNGRMAMVAIVSFVVFEAVFGRPIVDLTPFFFHPFWETIASVKYQGIRALGYVE